METLDYDNIHPIVLDPRHPLTKLIIKHYDEKGTGGTGFCVVAKPYASINTSVETVKDGEPIQ